MESILSTVKKMLGLDSEYDAFDQDIVVNINSALMTLTQLGLGPSTGFLIHDESETWTDFLGSSMNLEAAKTYVYLKVKSIFDPPTSSYVVDSMAKTMQEFEWRLMIQADPDT